ncbi:hypothetical protein HanRHA438_Chr04g0183871 [Helianthus annuus]|nr:hypothetical protein HanRHA438_Chr04g0183871 [Helianthus annuus]
MGASVVVNLPISDLVPAVLGVHAQLKEVTLMFKDISEGYLASLEYSAWSTIL